MLVQRTHIPQVSTGARSAQVEYADKIAEHEPLLPIITWLHVDAHLVPRLKLALPSSVRYATIPLPKRVHPLLRRVDAPVVSVRFAPEGALAQFAVPIPDIFLGALLVSPLVPTSQAQPDPTPFVCAPSYVPNAGAAACRQLLACVVIVTAWRPTVARVGLLKVSEWAQIWIGAGTASARAGRAVSDGEALDFLPHFVGCCIHQGKPALVRWKREGDERELRVLVRDRHAPLSAVSLEFGHELVGP
eukprot:scaffold58483_cov66-Phaeocystis_antarctica.AAC.3